MHNGYNKKSYHIFIRLYTFAAIIFVATACKQEITPRPEGYFRIDAYPNTFRSDTLGDIILQINDSAQSKFQSTHQEGIYWLNTTYHRYNATLYFSYITLNNNLERLINESLELVYRQNINTTSVEAVAYEDTDLPLYATLYKLSPQSATPLQFIATDSSHYLLRGTLYFDSPVKPDSVAPSLQYLEEDIMYLIENITPIAR